METHRTPTMPIPVLWLALAISIFTALACSLFSERQPAWTLKGEPLELVGEVQHTWEVFIPINEQGRPDEVNSVFGANARMRYVIRFWNVGAEMGGMERATIYRVYTPFQIVTIMNPESYSEAEKARIFARSTFPTSEISLHELTFGGGPYGLFQGTSSETGNALVGKLTWSDDLKEWHVVFEQDIKQDYLIISTDPFPGFEGGD